MCLLFFHREGVNNTVELCADVQNQSSKVNDASTLELSNLLKSQNIRVSYLYLLFSTYVRYYIL